MRINDIYDYDKYDEYYDGDELQSNFIKLKSKNKKKKMKGHQSKHQQRDCILDEEDCEPLVSKLPSFNIPTKTITTSSTNVQKTNSYVNDRTPSKDTPAQSTHTFGPNTQEIKGYKIDFDGVANIEQVQNELNGNMTFGIKFTFKGKKGLFRFVWYGTNQHLRDLVFTEKYLFWSKLPK